MTHEFLCLDSRIDPPQAQAWIWLDRLAQSAPRGFKAVRGEHSQESGTSTEPYEESFGGAGRSLSQAAYSPSLEKIDEAAMVRGEESVRLVYALRGLATEKELTRLAGLTAEIEVPLRTACL